MLLLIAAAIDAQPMTHYWDCCKPSCGWDAKQGSSRIPLRTLCDEAGRKVGAAGLAEKSACDAGGRGVTMCADQAPFYEPESGRWMGFVATQDHGTRADCCDCYELTLAHFNKSMVVQITNHGMVNGVFDMLLPGGGFGADRGCEIMFPKSGSVEQDEYGGLHHARDCAVAFEGYPQDIAACEWMFAGGAFPFPSPGVKYPADATVLEKKRVVCPAQLNERSGCSASGPAPSPGPGPSPGPVSPPSSPPPSPPPPSSPPPPRHCPHGLLKCVEGCPAQPVRRAAACYAACLKDCSEHPPPPTPPLPESPPPPHSCRNRGYAQCGGKGWKGPTCCPDGFHCVPSGDYWAQCEPTRPDALVATRLVETRAGPEASGSPSS